MFSEGENDINRTRKFGYKSLARKSIKLIIVLLFNQSEGEIRYNYVDILLPS